MLQTYQAEVNGSQLIWIDKPPMPLEHARVVVVVERLNPSARSPTEHSEAYDAFIQAEGCLGAATRAEIDTQLSAMRNEWNRPLGA